MQPDVRLHFLSLRFKFGAGMAIQQRNVGVLTLRWLRACLCQHSEDTQDAIVTSGLEQQASHKHDSHEWSQIRLQYAVWRLSIRGSLWSPAPLLHVRLFYFFRLAKFRIDTKHTRWCECLSLFFLEAPCLILFGS